MRSNLLFDMMRNTCSTWMSRSDRELLDDAKRDLDAEFAPAAYNIGINDGPAAGQTVPHLHIHLIPRYEGDCADPRGGVRWIVPDKADYWSARDRDGGPDA